MLEKVFSASLNVLRRMQVCGRVIAVVVELWKPVFPSQMSNCVVKGMVSWLNVCQNALN